MKTIKTFFQIALAAFFGTQKQKHDFAVWGYPSSLKGKDEYDFQDIYKCKFCNGELAQDSTGAWFHLSH